MKVVRLSVKAAKHRVAEPWAQLRAGTSAPTGLERGFWYRVRERTPDGMVLLYGPGDVPIQVLAGLVRVVEHEPGGITRVQESEVLPVIPGRPAPLLTYYGLCPAGHWVGRLGRDAAAADCARCGRSFPVEDEESV